MPKRLYILLTTSLALISCQPTIQKQEANVNKIQGLYVFIYSQPQTEYTVINQINNNLMDQFSEATRGKKKFKDVLQGIVETGSRNIAFQKLLYQMVTRTKQQYPSAEALIFDHNMSNARVIKFKTKNKQ